MSEDETLIIKKNSTEIRFDKKIVHKSGEVFLSTTKFYRSTNEADILDLKKCKPEGETYIQLEGTAFKK